MKVAKSLPFAYSTHTEIVSPGRTKWAGTPTEVGLADRLGGLLTLLIGSVLQCIALFMYLPAGGLVSLYVVSAIFGLSQGGIVPSAFPAGSAPIRVSSVPSFARSSAGPARAGEAASTSTSNRAAGLQVVTVEAVDEGEQEQQ